MPMSEREVEKMYRDGLKCIKRQSFAEGRDLFETAAGATNDAEVKGPLLYNAALCHAGLGNADKAFECLEKAVSISDAAHTEFLIKKDFPSLESDPRHAQLKMRCKGTGGAPLGSFPVFVGNKDIDLSETITRLGPNTVFNASALREALLTINQTGIVFSLVRDDDHKKVLAQFPLDSVARIDLRKNSGPSVRHQLIRPALMCFLTGGGISAAIFFLQQTGPLNLAQRIGGFIVATMVIGGVFMLFNLLNIKWSPLHLVLIVQRTTNKGIAAWINDKQLARFQEEARRYGLAVQESCKDHTPS